MLTANFTLEEMTASSALDRYNKTHDFNLKNRPNADQLKQLELLCTQFLQPLRDAYGPIKISSGFRSELVNNLVGGAANSLHTQGRAADIYCSSWEQAFTFAAHFLMRWQRWGIGFDELIVCRRISTGSIWVHIGVPRDGIFSTSRKYVSFKDYK